MPKKNLVMVFRTPLKRSYCFFGLKPMMDPLLKLLKLMLDPVVNLLKSMMDPLVKLLKLMLDPEENY